jgi:hypothetical protein
MSTGLSVIQAVYGAGSSTTDVTASVAAKAKDGVLSFTVNPTSLNVTDPAVGQMKTLNIVYTINGGSRNSITKKDGDSVYIDAPPARTATGLQITKAEYGYNGNYTDVTDAIQNLIKSDGSISTKVGFKEVGIPDPNPNKQKELVVDISINGSSSRQTLKDGETFQLSAPPVKSPSNSTLSQDTGSFIGSLFAAVARFFGVALHSLSVFTAITFGRKFISPILWGGIAFFVPLFSFWALPIIVLGIRLFSTTDVVPLNIADIPPVVA